MQYADGTVERTASGWREVDPMAHISFTAPYIYESDSHDAPSALDSHTTRQTYFWGELCWPDAARRLTGIAPYRSSQGTIGRPWMQIPIPEGRQ
jgi:hypothetical protein